MRKIALLYILLGLFLSVFAGNTNNLPSEINSNSNLIYKQIGNNSLSFEAFDLALRGYMELKDSLRLKENIITVVDFSQPSTKKRFYLINIDTKKVLYQDYVAHGKNTGVLEAKEFSNNVNSNQSSLGFFKTGETYQGKNGFSLRLDGLEKGINELARKRGIVIHSAYYVEESFIKKYGRLGRSFGCPTLPSKNYNEIIELIKDGTLLFIYSPEESYLQSSKLLN
jgi:hypothetical protein